MSSAVEKKVNMSLDDIIKACRPGNEKRSGTPRNNTAQDERIPLPKNGLAPKFIGGASAGRQQGGKQGGRRGQQGTGGRAQGALAARQAPMKKYQSRTSGGSGRPVTAVRVTIHNTKKAGRTPPPGFVGVPKYNPKGSSASSTSKPQRAKAPRPATLNERFTIIAAPAASRGASAPSYQPQRRSSGSTRKRRGGGGGGGGQGAAPMEM